MTQRNRPAFAPGPSKSLAINLNRIWDVQADRSYDVSCNRPQHLLLAIRTTKGSGEITMENRPPFLLEKGSFITLEHNRLRRYRCMGEHWHFWWFEFSTMDPFPAELNTPASVQGTSCDPTDFETTIIKLQHPSSAERCIAAATFSTMLHRWLAEIRRQRHPSPHRQVVETLISRIHSDLAHPWTSPQLSSEAGLCETLFRQEFKKATGTTPAKFIHEARLHAAAQMIEKGIYTLEGIAEQLNFSSPFHLSSAFKRQFGVSPSEYRTNRR